MKLYIFCPMIHGSSKNYKKYTHFFENLTYSNSDLYCLYHDKTSMKLNIMWFKLIWNRAPFFPGKGPILVFRFSDINCQSIKITPSQVLPEKRMKNLTSPSLSEVSNGCYGPTSVKMQHEHDNPLINPQLPDTDVSLPFPDSVSKRPFIRMSGTMKTMEFHFNAWIYLI